MPDPVTYTAQKSKRGIIVAAIVCVLVGLGIVGYFVWHSQQKPAQTPLETAQTAINKGDPEAAKKTLEDYVAKNPPAAEKAAAEQMLGAIYTNQGDKAKGIAYSQAAVQDDPNATANSVTNLAEIQEAAGQKEQALASYKKALEINNKKASVGQAPLKTYLEDKIKKLSGG